MNQADKNWLLKLARSAIQSQLFSTPLEIGYVKPIFKKQQACFVTLTKSNQLRGCIGHLKPIQLLFQDVIDNAKASAFSDYRFSPVTQKELPQIKIEISILSQAKPFFYSSTDQLLSCLAKHKPGLILSHQGQSATFLPQVWEELPDPIDFLSHLCLKAGLSVDQWRYKVTLQTYQVAHFSE